jgi:DNA-binding protein HU-beta
MNKTQLIDAIAVKAGLSKAEARKALDALIVTVGDSLRSGDKVAVVGFGSFSLVERSARNGRNPRSGQTIKIPARKVVKFRAGNELMPEL